MTTRYCYDTEFLEDGISIELISIGIAADDGREYYAVNSNLPMDRIRNDSWLLRNVMPSLPVSNRAVLDNYLIAPRTLPVSSLVNVDQTATGVKPRWVIANEVRDFLRAGDDETELWADYAAYDHVALAQLWGKMIHLPNGIPMYTNDIRQAVRTAPAGFEEPVQESGQHNALGDARHNLAVLRALDAAL